MFLYGTKYETLLYAVWWLLHTAQKTSLLVEFGSSALGELVDICLAHALLHSLSHSLNVPLLKYLFMRRALTLPILL